jgi:leader peptidase (prepilin peptidase)/N-methyltransferase
VALPPEVLSPWVLGLLGLCIGSFLNVVIHRLPMMLERQWWSDVAQQFTDTESWRRVFGKDMPASAVSVSAALGQGVETLPRLSLARPASRCPSCGHVLRWHENIPLLGWLRLKGRCSACGVRISSRYPLIELLTAAAFVAVGWRYGPTLQALVWCAVAATLIALAMIDWDTTVLPDALTLPLLWAGMVAAALDVSVPLTDAMWGAVVGYLSLWSFYWIFMCTTGMYGWG